SYCMHRDLHSFPTRRSSDLINYRKCEKMGTLSANFYVEHGSNETPTKADYCDDLPRGPRCRGLVGDFLRFDLRTQRRLPSLYRRSEEHTSELQSLAYLVCRL